MSKILIVEDDQEIALIERDYLEVGGYEVECLNDGTHVVETVLKDNFDLIILDLMLPGINGYDICKEIRDKIDIPILMVTAKTETIDKIRGLGLGADDYIAKPFDPAELIARVKSHLKMYSRLKNNNSSSNEEDLQKNENSVQIGNIKIMLQSWKVYKNDKEIKLPHREFELLRFFALNPNIVFSKDALFEKIWGFDYIGDNSTVTVHINRIREKIENDPKNPTIIETVWGAGYRLNM